MTIILASLVTILVLSSKFEESYDYLRSGNVDFRLFSKPFISPDVNMFITSEEVFWIPYSFYSSARSLPFFSNTLIDLFFPESLFLIFYNFEFNGSFLDEMLESSEFGFLWDIQVHFFIYYLKMPVPLIEP